MMSKVKNILFSFVILISFFFSLKHVKANTINKIDMDVYINSNGSASVTEVWNATLYDGTEGYRPFINLEDSTITNFTVSDDTGRNYEVLSDWDTSASFDEKSYKNGINYTASGVELCFGISKYGNRTYTLKYNISNFVTQYTDKQGIYFNFLNLEQYVNSAKITIHSDIPFSLDNARIWAFGYDGKDIFEDGKIILDSDGSLLPSQYMVGLVRFENNLFNLTNKSDKSFDDIYNSAFNKKSNVHVVETMLLLVFMIPLFLIFNPIFWIVVFIAFRKSRTSNNFSQLNFGENGKILPSEKDINYWRDIPCNKDLERAYWVCKQYNVVSDGELKKGIIGAILLKWIQKGYISVTKTKQGLLDFKDDNYAIDLNKITQAENEIEESLLKILLEAAGSNKILEAKEFLNWSKKNCRKINSWFLFIDNKEQDDLEKQGLITSEVEKVNGSFGSKKTITKKNVSPKLKEDAIQMIGLKKFLLDFSIMPKREYFEVHIWEEYLIFAQLLGIADKVEEQFSKLYPKINNETLLNTKSTIIATKGIASICYEGVKLGTLSSQTSHSSNNYSGSSRSSGSGGSSYSSGGSSAGGSKGGGFR